METKWTEHKGKKVMIIDYTGIKMEKDMITQLHGAVPLLNDINAGDNLYIMSDLTGCYTTPGFIDAAKKLDKDVLTKYKLKWSIVGITGPKVILLKGFNLIAKNKIEPFPTRELALDYLVK